MSIFVAFLENMNFNYQKIITNIIKKTPYIRNAISKSLCSHYLNQQEKKEADEHQYSCTEPCADKKCKHWIIKRLFSTLFELKTRVWQNFSDRKFYVLKIQYIIWGDWNKLRFELPKIWKCLLSLKVSKSQKNFFLETPLPNKKILE